MEVFTSTVSQPCPTLFPRTKAKPFLKYAIVCDELSEHYYKGFLKCENAVGMRNSTLTNTFILSRIKNETKYELQGPKKIWLIRCSRCVKQFSSSFDMRPIRHLHDDVIWLQLPECTSLQYLLCTFVTHERFSTKEKNSEYNTLPQSIRVKWRHHAIVPEVAPPPPPKKKSLLLLRYRNF